jgi:hypothetical protein
MGWGGGWRQRNGKYLSSPRAIPRFFSSHAASFSGVYESFGSKSATFPINPQAPHVVAVSLSQTTRPPHVDSRSGTHVTATVRFSVSPHFGHFCGDCCFCVTRFSPQSGASGFHRRSNSPTSTCPGLPRPSVDIIDGQVHGAGQSAVCAYFVSCFPAVATCHSRARGRPAGRLPGRSRS